ncbi:uncharacterized protein N7458_009338 [Penicillium daleae]|uniref:Clock-controlled protein 6 n=1 Tax=Penicillium daleae TaxID=63821 RepID=A0AAD6FYB8_9EURO|nr:uncharacterized protein N7458_009338 [Penicillium daleae]KAJ5438340.1 hypothetical protein N7458_009338 [Penicillium daleae]
MRFSFAAAVAALAAGAVASDAVTETLTSYTTYCPEATSIVHGGSTYSISTVRVSPPCCVVGGSRPLDHDRLLPRHPPSDHPDRDPVQQVLFHPGCFHPCLFCHLHPLVPSSVAATGTTVSTPAASQPAFNAGAINAATGAGAGLAAVFGVVALLL